MTKYFHTFGQYQDGYQKVDFCRLCGAEGQQLLEDCPGEQRVVIDDFVEQDGQGYSKDYHWGSFTQEEFDIKYGRIDENGLTKRNYRYKY